MTPETVLDMTPETVLVEVDIQGKTGFGERPKRFRSLQSFPGFL